MGIKVVDGWHTNLNASLHGGMFMTLMDNSTGIAAATMGKRVVTVTTSTTFIKGARIGDEVEVAIRSPVVKSLSSIAILTLFPSRFITRP